MTHQQTFDALKAELATIGWIRRGTIRKRYMRCGTHTCRCQKDPPQLHGPYYDYDRTINGTTKSRRLTHEQAQLVQGWIDNGRRLNDIIKQMEHVAHEHTKHLLQVAAITPPTTKTGTNPRPNTPTKPEPTTSTT